MSDEGKFVWHDLMTTDVEGSYRFYSQLFGWKSEEKDMKQAHYVHLKAGERHIGGMVPLDASHGAPPHWVGYVEVASTDATVKRAVEAGAKVYMPARDIDVGRFAVLGDPQGAVISPFEYKKHEATPAGPPPPGTFCWDELYTSDVDKAKAFYTSIFGWTLDSMEMPGAGTYWLFKSGGQSVAGMMKLMPGGAPHPHWLPYVAVASTDATLARATELGARVVMPPMEVAGVGRFAVLLDPQHAAIAVLQPAAV